MNIDQCRINLCLELPFGSRVLHVLRGAIAVKPILMRIGSRVLAVHVGL